MAKNIYGVQTVKEPDVRSGMDIAGSVAGAAATGAQAGAQFGPWGAAIVGAGFAAKSLYDNNQMKKEELRQLDGVKQDNKGVEGLEDRAFRTNNYVSAQAKHGMNSKNKYETAEIEGDGSKSPNGIGEIHVDKNYNIKNVAKGAKKHEEGGYKINNLEEDDIIFPTQNSTKEYNNIMGAIKRYKINGDKRAKRFLDTKRNALPTDADYGYNRNGAKYKKGKGNEDEEQVSAKNQLRKRAMDPDDDLKLTRRQIRMMSDGAAESMIKKLSKASPDPKEDTKEEYDPLTEEKELTYEELYGNEENNTLNENPDKIDPPYVDEDLSYDELYEVDKIAAEMEKQKLAEEESKKIENYVDEDYTMEELYGVDEVKDKRTTPVNEYPGGRYQMGSTMSYEKGVKKTKKKGKVKLSKKAFFEKYYPIIRKAVKDSNSKILPQTAMAQFIQENGWYEFKEGSTAFGIKATKSQKAAGKGKVITTTEVIDGKRVTVEGESFIPAKNLKEGVEAYLKMFENTKNPKYIKAKSAKTAQEQIKYIADGNYATANKAHTDKNGKFHPAGGYERSLKQIIKDSKNSFYTVDETLENNKIEKDKTLSIQKAKYEAEKQSYDDFVATNSDLIKKYNYTEAQTKDLYKKDQDYKKSVSERIDGKTVAPNLGRDTIKMSDVTSTSDTPERLKSPGSVGEIEGLNLDDFKNEWSSKEGLKLNTDTGKYEDRYDLQDLDENEEEPFVDPSIAEQNPTDGANSSNVGASAINAATGAVTDVATGADGINTAGVGGSAIKAVTDVATNVANNVANTPGAGDPNEYSPIELDDRGDVGLNPKKKETITRDPTANTLSSTDQILKKKREYNNNARRRRNDELWEEINTIEDYSNPLKYASMINKGVQGMKPIDEVERRFMNPEMDKYVDTSAKQRQNIIEDRNYQSNKLDGKGLSAGQQQSYNRQIGTKYVSNNEEIENLEFKKRNAIESGNVAKRNTAQEGNITLANQYDAYDDQAKGKRQAYRDQAISDLSQFALNDEKKRMQEARNRKQYKIQEARMRMMGTNNYRYNANPLDGSRYYSEEQQRRDYED